jgi:hypothetical protein
MKTEVKVEELKSLIPSKKETIYLQTGGLLILFLAFCFYGKSIIFVGLLMVGMSTLTRGFDKLRIKKQLNQLIEERTA